MDKTVVPAAASELSGIKFSFVGQRESRCLGEYSFVSMLARG